MGLEWTVQEAAQAQLSNLANTLLTTNTGQITPRIAQAITSLRQFHLQIANIVEIAKKL
jgi:hypothetical protein